VTSSRKKNAVTVLGATGSIGDSTLDIIAQHSDKFDLFAVSGNQRIDKLAEICRRFKPIYAVTVDRLAAECLEKRIKLDSLDTKVIYGEVAFHSVCSHPDVDVVVTGIVGAAGLLPTLSAIDAGKKVLIANKEPLVMMGQSIILRAQASGATLVPLDSEHNAILQCLPQRERLDLPEKSVSSLLLTASGGPFRTFSKVELAHVTPAQAIAHPNWSMGTKISVDSATLMNKGLELIEACILFSMHPSDVRVVIHPQSAIHSMVEYIDGSYLAQLGSPDMRIPIAYGLAYPERITSGAEKLDFTKCSPFEFEEPDLDRFPCLRLAREAAEAGGIAPIVLSAANEVAVGAFLNLQIRFTDIPTVIEFTLDTIDMISDGSVEQILSVDEEARRLSKGLIERQFSG
jgi:1-deoxy-D-xylulose-5-phosphate reductoisomerase